MSNYTSRASRRKIIHLFFWILYTSFLCISILGFRGNETINLRMMLPLLFQFPVFYINYRFLVPKYLEIGKLKKYTLGVITVAILVLVLTSLYYAILATWIPNDLYGHRYYFSRNWAPILAPKIHISNLFSSLTVLLFSTAFYFYEENQNNEQREIELISLIQESKLQFLKSQINPHFLFNVLNNIYTLSVIKSDKTPESIQQLSGMLRYVLYECNNVTVSISKEIDYITDYIHLIKLKDDRLKNIHFEHHVEFGIPIAPMIFIPFIENCFKHSNFEDHNEGWVNITLKTEMNRIIFVCENSVSKNKQSKDKIGGIGIKNVRSRLHALYPNKHALTIQQMESSFHVMLWIDPKGLKQQANENSYVKIEKKE